MSLLLSFVPCDPACPSLSLAGINSIWNILLALSLSALLIAVWAQGCFWICWLTSTCIRICHHLQGLQPPSPTVVRRLPLSVSKQPWPSAKNLRQRQSLTDRGTSVSLTAFPAFKVGERGIISVLDPNCSPSHATRRNVAIMCQMGNLDKLNV